MKYIKKKDKEEFWKGIYCRDRKDSKSEWWKQRINYLIILQQLLFI